MSPEKALAYLCNVTLLLAFAFAFAMCNASAADTDANPSPDTAVREQYRVQPGDVLFISVWREETLQREVTVQPDGVIRFPLAGQVNATGLSLAQIEQKLKAQLSAFIPDPAISVSLLQSLGNRVYVVGKVNNPGEYVLSRKIDVIQALALAGGMTPFAKKSKVKVLRSRDGKQQVLHFNYKKVEKGDGLMQSIFLMPGDTIIVP